MASKLESTPQRTLRRRIVPHEEKKSATPEKIESTVCLIREDMRELEDLRKKSVNLNGRVSGQMRDAIQRVEQSLSLLTFKAKETEKLQKRVAYLERENMELMAKQHCTYSVRATPEHEKATVENPIAETELGVRDSGPEKPVTSTDREEFKEEFRKLREFVAEEIRAVREVQVVANKKSYASCLKKTAPKQVEPDGKQVAGPSKLSAPERRSGDRENPEIRKKTPKNPPCITIRVRGNSGAYAAVVSRIKTNINPADFDVSVLSLRKTPSGEAEFRLGGNAENAKRFEEAIKTCIGDEGTLRKIQPMALAHVSDLESDITEETIIRDICKVVKIGAEEIKVSSIRPAYGSTMKASIKMPKKAAELLCNTGRAVIGYVSCRCVIRDFEPRCFRCGELGHIAVRCTGPDNSDKCFGCGSGTHRIAECQKKGKPETEKMDSEPISSS